MKKLLKFALMCTAIAGTAMATSCDKPEDEPGNTTQTPAEKYSITITVSPEEGGSAAAMLGTEVVSEVEAGKNVRIKATPVGEWELAKWIVESDNVDIAAADLVKDDVIFVMPEGDVSIKAEFVDLYSNITVSATTGGSAVASVETSVKYGTTVTLTATPDPYYKFVSWMVETYNADLESASSAETTFEMPLGDVSVKALFAPLFVDADKNYFSVWQWDLGEDGVMQVTITDDKFSFTAPGDYGYTLEDLVWIPITGSGSLAGDYPKGYAIYGTVTEINEVQPSDADGYPVEVGGTAVEYWFIKSDKSAIAPGEGEDHTEVTGDMGPYMEKVATMDQMIGTWKINNGTFDLFVTISETSITLAIPDAGGIADWTMDITSWTPTKNPGYETAQTYRTGFLLEGNISAVGSYIEAMNTLPFVSGGQRASSVGNAVYDRWYLSEDGLSLMRAQGGLPYAADTAPIDGSNGVFVKQ